MNVVTVKINGVEYNLKGEEKEEYLHNVAFYVDKKLKNILSSNDKLSTSSAAVLTAVNAVDDLMKCDRAYTELATEVGILENSKKLLVNQVEELSKRVLELEYNNKELQAKLQNSSNDDIITKNEEDIARLNGELSVMQEVAQKYIKDNNSAKAENKELKFQLQSAKYKIIDLQSKLIENQIDLVKVKKKNNPLINSGK